MKAVTHAIIYDIILGIIHLAVDTNLVYHYFSTGDTSWAAATLTAIFLPGLLEGLVYTYSYLHGDLEGTSAQQLREFLHWIAFSLFFPISLILWHVHLVIKGEKHFNSLACRPTSS